MSNPKTRISLRSKILIPLFLGGVITAFFGAWVSYQTAIGQLKNQLIERSRLLSITINEVTELLVENDDIRVAVDVLVRKEIGVHGISVATKEPFVIWASSLHPDTVNDQLVQEMLELLMTATERGIFGHYFEDNGDYVAVWPLQMRGKNDIVSRHPLESANGSKRTDRSLISMENRRQPIFAPESIIRIPATAYRGAIYLRFDWATVKLVAADILWLSVIIMMSGIVLMILLTYIVINYTVLQPISAIGVTINKQEDGDTMARVPVVHNDEIGWLANAFNQMLDALIERDRRFRTVVDHLPVAVTLRDIKGKYYLKNRQFIEWFGNGDSDNVDPRRSESSPGNIQLIRERAEKENQVVTTVREVTFEDEHSKPAGGTRWYVTTLFPVQDINGELTATGAASTDISERKLAEKHIEHLAYYDSLTQIPNRSLFRDRMEQSLKQARRNRTQVGLFYLDLDGFKTVNDTFGHRIGDQLLKLAAKRLRENVREQDTVARMGGDEFTIIIGDVPSLNAGKVVTDIAEKIKSAVAEPFNIDEHEVLVSTSMGIALYPKDGDQVDELLKRADMAMYQSKSLGHNNYEFFSKDIHNIARKRQWVEEELKHALDKDEFSVYYQPQFDTHTGDLAGMESLLRWTNSKLGSVSSTDFISVAEDTGLIVPIGEWVLRRACEQLKAWQDEGFALPRVAVNMSPRQLKPKDLAKTIEHILNDTKLAPSCLELGITERVLIRNSLTATSVLNDLKMLNVGLVMDDFGTGYSSLSYLRQIPFDAVKIDQTLIREIPTNQKESEFLTAIIAMARGLNLEVIVEGVDTMEHWKFLRSLHCNRIQGRLTGMPMLPDKMQLTHIKGILGIYLPSADKTSCNKPCLTERGSRD